MIEYFFKWKLKTIDFFRKIKKPVYLGDIKKIDKKFGETILGLQEVVMKKREIERNESLSLNLKNQQIERLTFKVITKERVNKILGFRGALLRIYAWISRSLAKMIYF